MEGVHTKGPEGVIQVEDHETRHSSDQTHCHHNSPLPQLTVNTDIIYGIQCQHKLKTNTTSHQNKWFEMSLKTRHSLLEYRFGDLLGKGTYGTVYKAFKKVCKDYPCLVSISCLIVGQHMRVFRETRKKWLPSNVSTRAHSRSNRLMASLMRYRSQRK